MTDVPDGIARLLSRATRPALPVGGPEATPSAPSPVPMRAAAEAPAPARAPKVLPRLQASSDRQAARAALAPDRAAAPETPTGTGERHAPSTDGDRRQLEPTVLVEVDAPIPAASSGTSAASEPPQPVIAAARVAEQPVALAASTSPASGGHPDHRPADVETAAVTQTATPQRAASQPVAATAAVVRNTAAPDAITSPAASAEQSNTDATARSAPAPVPVVIGQITVQVSSPEPAADPFAGCRALADGLTAKRGGGW
jgi:hypothetical protein